MCTDVPPSKCLTNFCAQNTFINQNADVFVGLVGWGAGSFGTSYVLSLTPTKQNNQYVDNQLMQQCMINVWANTVTTASSGTSAAKTVSNASLTPVVVVTVAPSGNTMTMTVPATEGTSTVDMSTAMMSGTDGDGLLTATHNPTATGGGGALETATIASNMTATGTSAGIPLVTTSGSNSRGGGLSLAVAVVFATVTTALFRCSAY